MSKTADLDTLLYMVGGYSWGGANAPPNKTLLVPRPNAMVTVAICWRPRPQKYLAIKTNHQLQLNKSGNYKTNVCKQLKVQYREKPPNELLSDIEEVVRRYPGVELALVELEQWKEVSTSCRRTRPPGLRAAPPQKKVEERLFY